MRIGAACAACFLVVFASSVAARADAVTHRAEFHRSYSLSAGGMVTINDAQGSIRVVGWDKSLAQVDALECAPTADALQKLTIAVDSRPNSLTINTMFPPVNERWFSWAHLFGSYGECNEDVEVAYTVHVPRRANVKLTSALADMVVVGPIATLRVDSASGGLSAADTGDLSAQTQSGGVTLRRVRGIVAVTTTSGDVMFNDASGDISVNSTSGEVDLYRVSGKAVVATTSGDIVARGFGGIARLSSISGDVSMTLNHGSGVALSVSTIHGDISSDVPIRPRAPIDVRTISGDVSVHSL